MTNFYIVALADRLHLLMKDKTTINNMNIGSTSQQMVCFKAIHFKPYPDVQMTQQLLF